VQFEAITELSLRQTRHNRVPLRDFSFSPLMDAVSLHYWMHLRTLLSTFHTTGTYIALRLTPARAMSKRSFDEVLKNADQKSATAKGRAKKAKKNVVMQFKTAIPSSSSSSSSSSSAIAIKSIASVNVSGFRACQNRSEKKPRYVCV
jgi:hypothetical protein